jgi:predicted 2-oxoglutarate/Fe(II)-dependent dioxygenase YbiX
MDLPRPFRPGDPVPRFHARASNGAEAYDFGSVAGRYVVLAFLGSAAQAPARRAMAAVLEQRRLFDDRHASFFGVSIDPADRATGRLGESLPGIRFFWDDDGAVSRRFGALGEAQHDGMPAYRGFWLVLDPTLRALASAPLAEAEQLIRLVAALPPVQDHAGCRLHAPVLILPRVFEPEFCRQLIEHHRCHGGQDSGFMREIDGKTVTVFDHGFKQRADHHLTDEGVRAAARQRIQRRVVPAIQEAFQFHVTRMERCLVACYDASQGGRFRAHRDNTTKGTAHRRFAVTLNLNAGEFEGGELCFPEFGPRLYQPPTGAALVFSCSLLHEARPVTVGRRYAFLPFLYDEAAARIRIANNLYLDESVGAYRG